MLTFTGCPLVLYILCHSSKVMLMSHVIDPPCDCLVLFLFPQTVVMTLAVVAGIVTNFTFYTYTYNPIFQEHVPMLYPHFIFHIGYTLAWLPKNVVNLVIELDPSFLESPSDFKIYLVFASHWLATAHTAYNPLIYAWINPRFRSAFKAVLSRVQCCPCIPSFLCPSQASGKNRGYPSTSTKNRYRSSNRTRSTGYSTSLSIRTRNSNHVNVNVNGSSAHRSCQPLVNGQLISKNSPIWT